MKMSAQLRMIAKGRFANGDAVAADRLARAAEDYDRLEQENAELRKAASSLLDLFDGVVFTHNTHQGRTDFLNARNNLKQLLNK